MPRDRIIILPGGDPAIGDPISSRFNQALVGFDALVITRLGAPFGSGISGVSGQGLDIMSIDYVGEDVNLGSPTAYQQAGKVGSTILRRAGATENLLNILTEALAFLLSVDVNGVLIFRANAVPAAGPAGSVSIGGATAATAAAGGGQAVPATVGGYLVIDVAGTQRKVPFFAT